MKTAALYVRVSKKTQEPETQLLALRGYARKRDYAELVEYVDFAWSGVKRNRPQLDQLMRDAKAKKFGAVIVARFDRFARSVHQLIFALEEFESLKIDFISLHESIDTTTPVGKLMFSIVGALAEFEREIIRDRIRDGLDRARAEGKQLGRPKRVFDRKKIRDLRKRGLSLREIERRSKVSRRTLTRALNTPGQNHPAHFAAPGAVGKALPARKTRGKTK